MVEASDATAVWRVAGYGARGRPERFAVPDHVEVVARERVVTDAVVTCGIPGHDRAGHEVVAEVMRVEQGPLSWDVSGRCSYAATFPTEATTRRRSSSEWKKARFPSLPAHDHPSRQSGKQQGRCLALDGLSFDTRQPAPGFDRHRRAGPPPGPRHLASDENGSRPHAGRP